MYLHFLEIHVYGSKCFHKKNNFKNLSFAALDDLRGSLKNTLKIQDFSQEFNGKNIFIVFLKKKTVYLKNA